MWGQNCRIVSNTLIDLGLGQILSMVQTRAVQVSSRELGVGKISMIEDGVAQIGRREISSVQSRMHQISVRKVGGFEVSFR